MYDECFTSFFFSFTVILHCGNVGRGGRGIKSFTLNKLIPREHKLTPCYQMAFLWLVKKREKSEQGKQQYLVFATSNPTEWRVFTATWKFVHYRGGWEEREREGSWFCTWCGFFLLVWSQLFPILFSSAAPMQAGPREREAVNAPPHRKR